MSINGSRNNNVAIAPPQDSERIKLSQRRHANPDDTNVELARRQKNKIVFLSISTISSIIYLTAIGISFSAFERKEIIINLASLNFGVACGWLLGGLFSPDNKDEENRFTRYTTAIASFATGYLLSKAHPVFEVLINVKEWQPSVVISILVGATGVLTALIVTFTARTYLLHDNIKRPKVKIFALIIPPLESNNHSPNSVLKQVIEDDTRLQLQIKKGTGPLYMSCQIRVNDEPNLLIKIDDNRLFNASDLGITGRYLVFRNEGNNEVFVRVKIFCSGLS
jgi:hypothetical protein